MRFYIGIVLLCFFVEPHFCIDCFRCNSTATLDCLEKFLHPNPLRPEPCSGVANARFCIKTTGAYDLHIGTKRFCSGDDLGNKCENVVVDGRPYRSCVYTCYTDGCNDASALYRPALLVAVALLFLLAAS